MSRILMGFAEAIPAPEALFSLRSDGHSVTLLYREGVYRPLLKLADGAVPVPDPAKNATGAIDAIRQAMAGHDLAYALDDDMLLLMTEGGAVPANRSIHATGPQAVSALDKRVQLAAAREGGLHVPPTLILGEREVTGDRPELPAIAKPALASSFASARDGSKGLAKSKASYITTSHALESLIASPTAKPLLVQPLIRGTGEGIFGFAHKRGISAWSGHRRVRMMNPHGSGSSACVAIRHEDHIRDAVTRMLAALEWHGPFMVELLRDATGTPWFMELNGRLWGSLALARRAGHEHPAWAVKAVLDPGFVPTTSEHCEYRLMRSLAREMLHPLFVARGPVSDFHREGWPTLWQSLSAWRPGRRRTFYDWDPSAPWFFVRDALWQLQQKVRG